MAITLTSKLPPPLAQADYEHLRSLQWENPTTAALRAGIGDDKLAIAYDPKAGCALIARKHNVMVKFKDKGQGYVEMYRPWCFWIDTIFGGKEGKSLSMNDPRLIEYVRKCDLWNANNTVKDVDADNAKHQASINKDADALFSDQLKEDESKFRKVVDDLGIVRHRDTGNDARKISSAAIWREGASKL